MSIDTEDRPTNIKSVVMPEAPMINALQFNAEKDVPDWMWQKCLKKLTDHAERQDFPSSGEATDYCELASHMLVLFPERRDELRLLTLNSIKVQIDRSDIYSYLSELRLMYPDQFATQLQGLRRPFNPQDAFGTIDSSLGLWDDFIQHPDKFEDVRNIPGLAAAFADRIKLLKDDDEGVNWHDIAFYKLMSRIYGFKAGDVSAEEWEAMKKYNQPTEAIDPTSYVQMAVYMKLLTAKEVRMTEEGLVIVMPESEAPLGTPSQVPVTKKY